MSHAGSNLEAGQAPKRRTTSGTSALGAVRERWHRHGRRPADRWCGTRCGGRRGPASRDRGRARGPPCGSSTPVPATMTPRAPAADASGGGRVHREIGAALGHSTRSCQGAPRITAGGRVADLTDQRLTERQVEVNRSGRGAGGLEHGAAGERSPRRAAARSATPGSWNHRTERAVEALLVDGLGCAHIAQLGWPIGRAHDAAAPDRDGPRQRRGAARPRRCRWWSAPRPARPTPCRCRAR